MSDSSAEERAQLQVAPRQARYLDRDLSDLAYVRRILEQAEAAATPLAERLRFLGISVAVLDEIIAVRLDKVDAAVRPAVLDGIVSLRHQQQACFQRLLEALEGEGIDIDGAAFDRRQLRGLEDDFDDMILPALTPLTVDREHPFPFIAHDRLCLIFEVRQPGKPAGVVVLPLPSGIPDFVPTQAGGRQLRIESLVAAHADRFLGAQEIVSVALFRLIRANDLAISEEFADLRDEVERTLEARPRNAVLALDVSTSAPPHLVRFLEAELLGDGQGFVLRCAWPGVARFEALQGLVGDALHAGGVKGALYPRHTQQELPVLARHGGDLFAAMREQDVVLHWPYHRFEAQIDFIRRAADDPDVVAIKQTLYRTDDEIVGPLVAAARNGKAVTVVLELEARENERHNVALSRVLEAAGARVVYGIIGLKVHAKLLLVVRREGGRLREYANFSTGNYHPGNARHYADLSLFTADAGLARELTRVFNYITGNLVEPATRELVVAPNGLREFLVEAIGTEADNARRGNPSGIWLKLNSLLDTKVIDALYEASQAGVPVQAVVRRHCALRPGVAGLSDGIEVKSIIGRYLEHTRMVCFGNGHALPSAQARVFLSSADWMPRNLDDRVEVLVPVKSERVRAMLVNHVMAADLRDTDQSWLLQPDGSYRSPIPEGFCAQTYFATTPYLS
ncbi:MAG: polyphosphate kinase 1 [Pseudomonadales bacterium]